VKNTSGDIPDQQRFQQLTTSRTLTC